MKVDAAHVSMQFKDSKDQIRKDFEKIFDRAVNHGYWWVTGTEMGEDANAKIGKEVADEHGYRWALQQGQDCWIAVDRKRIVKDSFSTSWVKVVDGEAGKYTNKGCFGVHFKNDDLGKIHVAAAHYLTKGRPNPSDPAYGQNTSKNKKIAQAIGDFAKKYDGLVFYGGDQNIVDKSDDTFFGEPLTTTWDELKKWPNTGHGNIDVLASADKNKNVKAKWSKVLDDSEFKLASDHFFVEGGWTVS